MQPQLEMVGDLTFTLKDISYTERPRMKAPFTVSGKVELLKIPFLAPIWVMVKVTYPEKWWEEIIPVIGSPTVTEADMVIGGDFEITFRKGFDREGEFLLDVEAYAGPTFSLNKVRLPPFPPVASYQTTFLVAGEVPPEELGFRNFRILSYSKNGGPAVTPPGVLELDIGDRCRVNVGLDHRNGAVTGKFYAAIWQKRPWDPHDEVLHAAKSFSLPSSTDWQPFEDYIDIPITSAISPGTEYGLYVKITGITGGDIFTEYLANVITIVGVPPPEEADIADWDFRLTKGTYDPGAKVSFTAHYKYKGIAQDGQLTISIGTGIMPTFNPVYTYEPLPVSFEAAVDWAPGSIEGDITLPDLEAGQTYSVRAKLETLTVKTEETDTDWSAFDIRIGPPASDIADWDFTATKGTYDLGAKVPYDASYKYKGKAQSGWLTISLGTGIYPSFSTRYTFPRVSVSFDQAMEWTPGQLSGSFTLPTTLEPGQTYSVRAKLETADGAQETDTDWGVFDITPAPPPPPKADIADFDFRAEGGTYAIGDRVPFSATYKYKGIKQSGQLVLELGTGVFPTFSPVVRYSPMPVGFDEAMDWESRSLEGGFLLTEALEGGRTYSVRAKLETLTDKTEEIDTDWGVITIAEVPAPPPPPPPPTDLYLPAPGFEATKGDYYVGDYIPFTMNYQYKGKKQGGYLTISIGIGVYPSFFTKYTFSPRRVSFAEAYDWTAGTISGTFLVSALLEEGQTYNVRAKLRTDDGAEEIDTDWTVFTVVRRPEVGYTLTTRVTPSGAGRVTKSPDKVTYDFGETVTLTAYPYSGYRFSYWDKDGAYLSSYTPVTTAILADHTITAHFERI